MTNHSALKITGPLAELCELTPTSLAMRPGTTLEQLLAIGRLLFRHHEGLYWLMGDWLNEVGHRRADSKNVSSEAYDLAVEITGGTLKREWLYKVAAVCRTFPPQRRRAELTFFHHLDVAYLKPAKQERWLDRAEAEKLSSVQLRGQITPGRPRGRPVVSMFSLPERESAVPTGPGPRVHSLSDPQPPAVNTQDADSLSLARRVARAQRKMAVLWVRPKSATEQRLQDALRKLHAALIGEIR